MSIEADSLPEPECPIFVKALKRTHKHTHTHVGETKIILGQFFKGKPSFNLTITKKKKKERKKVSHDVLN